MDMSQIKNLYKVNGIADYQLKSTEDLLKTHGVDYKSVAGYNRLDDLNKRLYEKFIVNIYNAWGLESRTTLFPMGIYFVEEETYAVKQEDEDGEYFLTVAGVVNAIDKNGLKVILHTWEADDYKHFKKAKSEADTYLRFEYEHDGRKAWLHVIDEESWY